VSVAPGSRTATNQLLAELRDGRWRPSAWSRFLAGAVRRSVRQARQRPRALAEITALHAGFAVLARGGRKWTVVSWALAATHLGMLEGRRSIGWADAVTLTRANLPTIADGWWLPILALGSDVADGRLARGLGTASPFGASADALADAAFWAWYALRHKPSRAVRAAAVLAWVAPVLTVTTISVSRGRMIDSPRPALLRPAAALQAALTIRAIVRRLNRSG
jgi:phosphatidylserine synthase